MPKNMRYKDFVKKAEEEERAKAGGKKGQKRRPERKAFLETKM